MKFNLNGKEINWQVKKIGVIGPGIVGMPMAALLANAKIKIGTEEAAKVIVVQRNSKNSGWKVDAINKGKSVIGGIEPGLNKIVADSVAAGQMSASHDYSSLIDADVILVCVQTDKKGFEPDYGPMFEALHNLAEALKQKPENKVPLIIFESTLAPSSMATVMKEHFTKYGLIEGKNILLGNSPNRVMPGRLVERVISSDKIVAGLHPDTPKMIKYLYSHIVTNATLHPTNSLTAEVVKTLENAYRDVRIAFSTEVVRYCDENNINFYTVREKVNSKLSQGDSATTDPNAVPSGGLLIPMIGVGGHCLPKDGILLWWRKIESGADTSQSLIINSRKINDESPAETIKLAERTFGDLSGKSIALLGAAYRFNSEDTRNSPALSLAKLLIDKNCDVVIHDPFVKKDDQNLLKFNLKKHFTSDLEKSLSEAQIVIICTAHKLYIDKKDFIINHNHNLFGIVDGCNIYQHDDFIGKNIGYTGIGRGKETPTDSFIESVYEQFKIVETGTANEVQMLVDFLNLNYADGDFNKIKFSDVQKLAGSCNTGCEIANTGNIKNINPPDGFKSSLVERSENANNLIASSN
ncbi:MAG: nucleotide sugar dehydrogenase [Ignavibacteriaceae bacterium]